MILDYKVKNSSNAADRTKILDLIRASLYQTYKQEFIFVVNKLNVSPTHAWFEGDVQRKDGKRVIVTEFDNCCHAEALLKRSSGKWYIVELSAFSTDYWFENIWERYRLPKQLILR